MRSFKDILLRTSVVLMLCIAVVLSSTIMPIAAGLAGDVNTDDTLTAEDLTIVRKSLLNGETILEYDINGDGKVDIRDLVNLKKKIAHYVDGEKFTANTVTEIGNVAAVKITELFAAKDGANIDSSLVVIDVNAGETGVTYEISADTKNWENSTILFKGTGEVTVSIREYSKTTSIKVNVVNVDKFAPVDGVSVQNDKSLLLGQLFTLLDGVTVDSSKVKVTVDNCEYSANTEDWKNSIVTFKNVGTATVTIEEESNPATTTVTVTQRPNTDKFQIKFPNTEKYLYRVGNGNAVALDSLFSAIEGADIRNVTATVTAIEGANVSGAFTPNADWTKATIQFSGTGIVKVTVKDDYYCNELTLLLEVVDAVNAIVATSAKSNNVVLLNDCALSTLEVSNGYTLYGNGFKLTATNDVRYYAMNVGFVTLNNGTLDNVQIICPNFSHSVIYNMNMTDDGNQHSYDSKSEVYGNVRSAVMADNESYIKNSYVHGGRAAVFVRSGNVVIDNSTISGGAAANIHAISAKNLILRDTTLIQKPFQATVHDTSKTLLGFSLLFECDENGKTTPVTLEGTLVQDTWIDKSDKQYIPSDLENMVGIALGKTAFLHNINGVDSLNLGLTFIPAAAYGDINPNITDNRTNKATVPYELVEVSSSGIGAKIYSYKNTNGTSSDFVIGDDYTYSPNTQGVSSPVVLFSDANENRIFTTEYKADVGWKSTLTVDLDQGNYNFSFANLIAQKYGKELNYTVKKNGTTVEKNTVISLTESSVTTYILEITDDLIYGASGEKSGKTAKHTYCFELVSTKTSIPEPVVADTTGGTPLLVVKSKGGDWTCAIPALEGIKIKYYTSANNAVILDLATLTPTSTGKQNETNNFWTTNKDGYKLKVTCGYIHDTKQIYGMPVVVNNSGNKMYFTISSTNGYVSTKTASRTVTISYEFTDPNGKTLTFSKTWQFNYADYKNGTQYSYDDFVKGTLKAASGCVTPDTLVTLADGSKKRIDQVTYEDMLLVWDFYKGEYTAVPCSIVMNHGYDYYNVVTLKFEDGTVIKTINGHGFFDTATNEYILLDEYNVVDYVGHTFVKVDGDSYTTTKLVDYSITNEYTESWSVLTAVHHNAIIEGMWSLTSAEVEGSPKYVMPFVVGEDMKYDEALMQADIEKYGLYTYEEFADIIPYEAFVALNIPNFKVAVGKGYITYDEIIFLIKLHVK